MTSWFGHAIKTLLKPESNPTRVLEVRQERYAGRPISCREDGLVLYGPDKKGHEYYEILLLRPCSETLCTAYSIYRVPELHVAEEKFISLKDKLPVLLNLSKDMCTVNNIQKICDTLHENPSWTLAHIAVQLNLLDLLTRPEVHSALNSPDPSNGMYPIHLAIRNLNTQAIKILLSSQITLNALDHEGNTVYHYAAETNRDIITALADNAPKYLNYRNASGHTPLHVACLADKRDCVKSLLLAGADVNVAAAPVGSAAPVPYSTLSSSGNLGKIVKTYDSKLHEEDMKHGGTPLHWAASREIIEDLVNNNCDINALNFNRRTALHVMVLRERLECTVTLLSHNCDVDVKDQDGNTALHIAAQKKNVSIIQALIIFGARLDEMNNNGETARHILAIQSGDQAKKALYILHSVGASRCTEPSEKCTGGCHINGIDIGIPPPAPKSYPARAILEAYTAYNRQDNPRGGRVLCLDGGGIRGLVLITILLRIEEVIGQPIIHCFDWISGTSTGAILALGLASGKTLHECLCQYFLMKEKIFVGSRPYPSETLENMLKELFGTAVMADIKTPKVIITGLAADNKPADLHLFRNYTPPEDLLFPERVTSSEFKPPPKPEEQLVWKAARASGAAPSYFRMFERYLDGGLVANNPTLDVLTEIHEYNLALQRIGRGDEAKMPSVIVSVGTGIIPVSEIKDIDVFRPESVMDGIKLVRGISALGTLLVDQVTLADGRVVERARAWCHAIGIPFFRFSPQLSEEITMDEKEDVKLVRTLWETKVYMLQRQEEVNKLVELLKC